MKQLTKMITETGQQYGIRQTLGLIKHQVCNDQVLKCFVK